MLFNTLHIDCATIFRRLCFLILPKKKNQNIQETSSVKLTIYGFFKTTNHVLLVWDFCFMVHLT